MGLWGVGCFEDFHFTFKFDEGIGVLCPEISFPTTLPSSAGLLQKTLSCAALVPLIFWKDEA